MLQIRGGIGADGNRAVTSAMCGVAECTSETDGLPCASSQVCLDDASIRSNRADHVNYGADFLGFPMAASGSVFCTSETDGQPCASSQVGLD